MRRPLVTRTMQIRYYLIWIRDEQADDIKEVVYALPHGPKQPKKIAEALKLMYGVDMLSLLDTWVISQVRGMTEFNFYIQSVELDENRKLPGKENNNGTEKE